MTTGSDPPPSGIDDTFDAHTDRLGRAPGKSPVAVSVELPQGLVETAVGVHSETLASAMLLVDGPVEPSRVGSVVGEKYRLVRSLSAGGMGEVFLGEHVTLGVPVAVKFMHPHVAANAGLSQRFRREARAMSTLSHPNIVRVIDFGGIDASLYLVMEFLEGDSMSAWLERATVPPPLAECLPILRQVFDALEVAHACGVVHRDLKPDNLFLTTPFGHDRPIVKLVDFGLAHVEGADEAGSRLTGTGQVAGTAAYMSPEQCRSLDVGPSTDLYAAGCVLTEMLQLRPPFLSPSGAEVMAKHMFLPPPALDRPAAAEPVPPLLEKLRLELLAKTPQGRPRSASEARARLDELLSPVAAEARLPSRKAGPPPGDREARGPEWEHAARSSPALAPAPGLRVGLFALHPESRGALESCILGLATQQIAVRELKRPEDAAREPYPAIIVDAGPDLDQALALLARLEALVPRPRVIVCAAALSSERINALVAAGAAEVVAYPLSPEALGKRLLRVLRRGR